MVSSFTLDLFKDPFFIGWDRHFKDLEKVMHNSTNYPPYNLVKLNDDDYIIELALAGFKKDDVQVEQEKNVLIIKGSTSEGDSKDYIHKGIGGRSFVRTFSLSEYMEVSGVSMSDGVLKVLIVRNVPEEAKPKTFDIVDALEPQKVIAALSTKKTKK